MITAKLGKAVFTPRKDYAPGDRCRSLDVVAHAGSLWACLEETQETPDRESAAWMHLLDGGTARTINTAFPLQGGRALTADPTLSLADASEGDTLLFRNGQWTFGKAYELCEFYYFRHPSLKPGFQPAHGGLITDASVKYPDAWEYLQSDEGKALCVTESEWQAMTRATWSTLADGTKVGWDGIGGAPYYAPNTVTGDLRLPDLRGMYAEAAGFDALSVGGVHGDGARAIYGRITLYHAALADATGAFYPSGLGTGAAESAMFYNMANMDTARVVPIANKNQPRAWGALACCYLGAPR